MQRPRRSLCFAISLASLGVNLNAAIIADALFSFPSQTEYLEYDNLTALRKLPNYNTLRQNFSGKPLEEAKAVLNQLGIEENEVQEVVSASTPTTFFGLLDGAFSGETVAKSPKAKRYAVKVLNDEQVYCAGRQTCILFLEDSLAAFGSVAQLRKILLVRHGAETHLSANRDAAELLNGTTVRAPVRGILLGHELQSTISDYLPHGPNLTSVRGLGYSITLDSKAHVNATIECTSRSSATLVSQALKAAAALESVTTAVMGAGGLPFENVQASSTGNLVHFQADSVLPSPARK